VRKPGDRFRTPGQPNVIQEGDASIFRGKKAMKERFLKKDSLGKKTVLGKRALRWICPCHNITGAEKGVKMKSLRRFRENHSRRKKERVR